MIVYSPEIRAIDDRSIQLASVSSFLGFFASVGNHLAHLLGYASRHFHYTMQRWVHLFFLPIIFFIPSPFNFIITFTLFIATLMDDRKLSLRVASMPTADKFQLHIYAALAEKEREFISTRTRAALAAAALHHSQIH